MRRLPIRTTLLISLTLLHLTGCGLWSRKVKIGEQFTLHPKERVVVADTGLTIRLDAVGHQWYVDQRPHTTIYVEVTVTVGNAGPRALTISDNQTIGDYTITLKSANEFRSDGGPRCELVVTRR